VLRINGYSWLKARTRANLCQCRGMTYAILLIWRLRAAGVSFENKQDLLGRKSSHITVHYCKADIDELREAVEKLSRENLA
jgi:hypothetical protein